MSNLRIKKIGHCCLVISDGETTIMTDPGDTTAEQLEVKGLGAIVITHKHADHLDSDTIQEVAKNNPEAVFIANEDAGSVLAEKGIAFETIPHKEARHIKSMAITAFSAPHEKIYEGVPRPENTGYLINDTLYIPGDSYTRPDVEVPVLAVPVSAPWGTIGDSIDFLKSVAPRKAFPIHDGMLKTFGGFHAHPANLVPEIKFVPLKPGEEMEV